MPGLDLDTQIMGAIHDATDGAEGEALPDAGDDHGTDDTADTGDDAAEAGAEGVDGIAAADTKPTEPDDLDKELEGYGVKRAVKGQRDNRIPYARVKKIVENAKKGLATAHEAALKERDGKLTAAEARAKKLDMFEQVDRIASTNPAKYVEMLMEANPAYKQFLREVAAAADESKDEAFKEPRPAPDAKMSDGSEGYTQKGFDALLDWNARKARHEAMQEFNKKLEKELSPLQQAEKDRANTAAAIQQFNSAHETVKGQLRRAEQIWGDLFTDKANQAEIEAALKSDQFEGHSFESVVSAVLTQKLRSQVETARADVIKELNERPAAARSKASGKAGKVEEEVPAEGDLDAIMIKSLRDAGL
jgi:hypothetical protein